MTLIDAYKNRDFTYDFIRGFYINGDSKIGPTRKKGCSRDAWAPVFQVLQHPAVSTGADLRGKSDD